MEEIKLWAIRRDDSGQIDVESVSTAPRDRAETELEELLVKTPSLLMTNLRLVGRQTPTTGGPLDLLGVDNDGKLVVFELKKGILYRQAVTQVVDYASSLADLPREKLAAHIEERSGNGGVDKIEDFNAWYQQEHSGTDYVGRPRMVLVGMGADEHTQRMTAFLADGGLDISLITFYSFEKDGKQFLARRIHVEGATTPNSPTSSYNRADNLRSLQDLATRLGMSAFLESVHTFLSTALAGCYWYPGRTGYSYMLAEQTEAGTSSNRQFASLYIQGSRPSWLQLSLHNRAIKAAGKDAFSALNDSIPEQLRMREHPKYSIWETKVRTRQDWDQLREPLAAFLCAVLEGRRQQVEDDASDGDTGPLENDGAT
jgi:hypothetical protein